MTERKGDRGLQYLSLNCIRFLNILNSNLQLIILVCYLKRFIISNKRRAIRSQLIQSCCLKIII
ncbi:unnamed protein product [Paramecium octaurelia]|uniref:Uncharacterized protein n=1 Tax=Paramecium octaurelia TaxID=43137 RepID=A0A8S1YRX6_PAROT|nr:unnamed protein product [Paramecium octaurelia]